MCDGVYYCLDPLPDELPLPEVVFLPDDPADPDLPDEPALLIGLLIGLLTGLLTGLLPLPGAFVAGAFAVDFPELPLLSCLLPNLS